MKISIVAAENKATDILVTVFEYRISHQITVQKSQIPTEKKLRTVHRHESTEQTLVLEERKPEAHYARTLRLGAGAVGASA